MLAWGFIYGAAAYLLDAPRLFGKRPDGRLAGLGAWIAGPFLGLTWLGWRLVVARGGAPCHRITETLWLGRRPRDGELPPEVARIVDLVAELPRAPATEGRAYLSVPTLDARPPPISAAAAVLSVASDPTPTLIHCAMGRGRSATFLAAVLIARGEAEDAGAAEAMMKAIRPGVRLHRGQRALLAAWFPVSGVR